MKTFAIALLATVASAVSVQGWADVDAAHVDIYDEYPGSAKSKMLKYAPRGQREQHYTKYTAGNHYGTGDHFGDGNHLGTGDHYGRGTHAGTGDHFGEGWHMGKGDHYGIGDHTGEGDHFGTGNHYGDGDHYGTVPDKSYKQNNYK